MKSQAYLFDNDTERFFIGWSLDKSFYLCTVSWSMAILTAAGVFLSAFVFSSEGDYDLDNIPRSERSVSEATPLLYSGPTDT